MANVQNDKEIKTEMKQKRKGVQYNVYNKISHRYS